MKIILLTLFVLQITFNVFAQTNTQIKDQQSVPSRNREIKKDSAPGRNNSKKNINTGKRNTVIYRSNTKEKAVPVKRTTQKVK